jgi:alkanesulfonate monooxygenase SsuD/methylene tetrahydromethanopterin reductase-like flavin-dependent oxidoreductase (luciferase family)
MPASWDRADSGASSAVRRREEISATRTSTALAGTTTQVANQLSDIASWFGDDITVRLRFGRPGEMPQSVLERALRLFADRIAPRFAHTSRAISARGLGHPNSR